MKRMETKEQSKSEIQDMIADRPANATVDHGQLFRPCPQAEVCSLIGQRLPLYEGSACAYAMTHCSQTLTYPRS